MRTIELPPYAPTLIESTRAIGYSLEAAIADIIDNSIAAQASLVEISFLPGDNPYLTILDDGLGMNADEIDVAMQYGSKSPREERNEKDLGRFGLGLKTASLSQCRVLTVVSKQGDFIVGRRWDMDHVIKTGSWSLLILEESDWNDLPQIESLLRCVSGTLVVWGNLDRLMIGETNFDQSFGRKMDLVREHLALVFHRYIAGESGIKKLCININRRQVEANDPFLVKKSTQVMDDEIFLINGHKVVIRPYILPHMSKLTDKEKKALGGKEGLRKKQGFYVYRNKRLIVWGTWFRMRKQEELSKLARIQVDIPNALDDLWTLDIKKSVATPPAEIRDSLEVAIDHIAEKSKRTWTFRGRKEIDDAILHIWQRYKSVEGGFYYEINRSHPLVEQIMKRYPEMSQIMETLLKQIEGNIPLDQLYVDLTNDRKIENRFANSQVNIEDALKQLINSCVDSSQRLEMLRMLEQVEPFSSHLEILLKYK